ncbi:non-specific lipid-transfer protein [Trifolium repens]|nr:non-specific lipid-transfer protein [Trifolium repens]
MANSILIKVTCFVVISLFLGISLADPAELCDKIRHAFIPTCFPYLRNPDSSIPPPEPCCNALKDINNEIPDTDERRVACKCMQFVITITPGADLPDRAIALPGKCGVDLPFQLSPWEECDRYISNHQHSIPTKYINVFF